MASERQTDQQNADGGLDFHAILAVLRRRFLIIVLCAVLFRLLPWRTR